MAAVSMPAPPVSSTVTIMPSSTATSLIWAARVTPPTRAILIVTPPAMPSRQAASSAAIESMFSSSTIGALQCSRTRRHSASVSQGCSSTWSMFAASRTNRSAEEVLQPALASANSTMSGPATSRTAASRSASTAGSPPTLTCSRRYPSARCRRARPAASSGATGGIERYSSTDSPCPPPSAVHSGSPRIRAAASQHAMSIADLTYGWPLSAASMCSAKRNGCAASWPIRDGASSASPTRAPAANDGA